MTTNAGTAATVADAGQDAKSAAITVPTLTNDGTAIAGNGAPLSLEELKVAAAQLGVKVVTAKKRGRPRKYSTPEESADVNRQNAKQYLEEHGYDKVIEHMANNRYAAQRAHHQRTGYAAQKAWRERQREKRLAQRLALLQTHDANAHVAPANAAANTLTSSQQTSTPTPTSTSN